MATSTNRKTTSQSRGKAAASSAGKKGTAAGRKKTAAPAAAKKKASAPKKTAAKRGKSAAAAAKSAAPAKEYVDYGLVTEIVVWILLGISVILLICTLGFGSTFGKTAASCMFGLMGSMAYVFPFLLFFLSAFLLSNAYSRRSRIKAAGFVLLFVTLCMASELLLLGNTSGHTLQEHYDTGAVMRLGGGALGGGLSGAVCGVIGLVGCWIIVLVLCVISIILITQKSVFSRVKNRSRRIIGSAKASRERSRARYLEEERARMEEERLREEEYANEERTRLPVSISILPREDSEAPRRRRRSAAAAPGGMRVITGTPQRKQREEEPARPVLPPQAEEDRPFETAEPSSMSSIRKTVRNVTLAPGGAARKKAAEPAAQPAEVPEAPVFDEPVISTPQMREEPAETSFAPDTYEEEEEPETAYAAPAEEPRAGASAAKAEKGAKAPAEKPAKSGKAEKEQIRQETDAVSAQIAKQQEQETPKYTFPPLSLLKKPDRQKGGSSADELRETAAKLTQVFKTFGVNVHITNVTCGPSVTRYELIPEMGVKVSKILSLQDDIQLNLAASDIRIEAPIPGKSAVGIEVPNKKTTGVTLRELLDSEEYRNHPSRICYAVGRDIAGKVIVSDLAKMPHLLIAGATGSGKSVFINTLIMSILYRADPEDVKLIMIDPKVVELNVYNGIPHLYIPVVTDPKKAAGALNWAVAEMEARYNRFAEIGVREIRGYNRRVEELQAMDDVENKPEKMPQIVIIVDELADLMMVSSSDVEDAIVRLTQLARAAGIHLVIATQRPSVDVITGLIKANIPSRIAFSVSSAVDSRTILDMGGAEKLLGNGDMLFAPQNFKQPLRVQGAFVSDAEVADIVDFIRQKNHAEDDEEKMKERMQIVAKSAQAAAAGGSDVDELFADAGKFIIEKDKASIGMLQRWFKIGFNRAARIMDQLSDAGVVGPEEGTKPRKIQMSMEEFENYLEQN